jgi:hypothetical protein
MVLFGGSASSTFFHDTWTWDGSNWAKVSDSGPKERYYASAAGLGGDIVLFGGWDGNDLKDTWVWDGSIWAQKNAPGPSAREGVSMVGP